MASREGWPLPSDMIRTPPARYLAGSAGVSGRLLRPSGAVFALALALALPASAQSRPYSDQELEWRNAGWVDDVYFTATNALVSGVATAVVAALRDDVPVGRAFLTGAVGGVAVYAGKRLAASRFDGAGFVGRQVAAVGTSVGRNAADGRGPLDELAFPLGWAGLYWDRVEGGVTVRPDVNAIAWSVHLAFRPGTDFDWGRSVSSGAPVFLTRDGSFENDVAGRTYGNVILADRTANIPLDVIVAHERVHVLQLDHHHALWGDPVERWATGLLGDGVSEVADRFALVTPTLLAGLAFASLWSGGDNPLESEAYYMHMRAEPR